MFNPERGSEEPKEGIPQQEASPEKDVEKATEQSVGAAVTEVKNRDEQDPVISSEWSQKAKEFFSTPAGKTIKYTGFGLVAAYEIPKIIIFLSIWRFAKKFIEKGGKMTLKEGYEIGKSLFPADGKKDKK